MCKASTKEQERKPSVCRAVKKGKGGMGDEWVALEHRHY